MLTDLLSHLRGSRSLDRSVSSSEGGHEGQGQKKQAGWASGWRPCGYV